jgi:hypothetical protein
MRTSRSRRTVIALLLLAGILVVTATGCRGLLGRNTGPIDAFAFLPQGNPQLTEPVQGAINNRPDPKEIALVVPPGTDVSRLVAIVTLNTEATVTVISTGTRVVQSNGQTPNNFSSPVTYAVELPGEDEPVLYTVRVREASTNARLIELSVAGGTSFIPAFGPTVADYEAEVPFATQTVQVTARAEDPRAFAISVNGVRSGAGQATAPVDFSSGDSVEVVVEVVAEDKQSRQEYRILVLRGEPDRNSNLAALAIDGIQLDQVFRPDRRNYTAVVPFSATEVKLLAQPQSEFATMSASGMIVDPAAATAVPIDSVQKQLLDLTVTAQDGSTAIYTISLTRAAPDTNVNLADITPSVGQLTPLFSPRETFYSLTLPADQDSVVITAEAVSPVTSVEINTDGAATRPGQEGSRAQIGVNVAEGDQVLVVVTTTAESGTTRDYRIAVGRELGEASVALTGLSLVNGSLTPAFDPDTTVYSARVSAETDSVLLSATPADPSLEIIVGNRSYAEGDLIDVLLFEGVTTKTPIRVRAPSGLEKTYTVTIDRPELPSRIGRRILQVEMDELQLSRQIASNLNSNRTDLRAAATIRVRYAGENEVIYEDTTPVVTEKSRQDILVTASYRSDFIDLDLGRYIDVEIAIPTTAGRYLHYNEVVYADGPMEIRPPFLVLSDKPDVIWPEPGTPRPVSARVLYQTSQQAQNRISQLGDAFRLNNAGEYQIDLELINLETGESLGRETLLAKPGSIHGRGITFADGIELPEGARIGYVLTAETRDGRLLRDHGVTVVRTTETFDDGEWEYASLSVEAEMKLVEE